MHIQEFQAKKMLAAYGVRVPAGEVAATADEARRIGERLPGRQWMVKAQIYAGGRKRGTFADGKSGIRLAATPDEIVAHAAAMMAPGKNRLVTAQTDADGLPVERVYIEQALEIERELALSLLVDERNRCLTLLLFERGGVGIEDASADDPAAVHRVAVHPVRGADAGQLDGAVAKLGLDASLQNQLKQISANIIRLFCEKDAGLIEVNPLVVCGGNLVALDAKMTFDKNALFRQPDILALENAINQGHRLASMDDFNYIPLDGDIACLAVGAGLSMATLDAIRHYHGRPASFLDLPPDSKVNRVVSALEMLLANPRTKSLLVNVFGGGIMRCDTVADAILLVNHSKPITTAMTVRLSGTNSQLANRRLAETMPNIFLATNLAQAAQAAVNAAVGGATAGTGSPSARNWLARLFARLRSVR